MHFAHARSRMTRLALGLATCLVGIHTAIAAEGGGPCDQSQATTSYIVRAATDLHLQPLDSAPTSGALKSGDRLVSSCRVKGQAGEWWLTVRSASGALAYILESATEKADNGTATAPSEGDAEKRSRDPLLQGKY